MDKNEQKIAPLTDQESKEMWENIISRIRVQEAKKRKKKITLFSIISTAAILVIASLLIYQYTLKPNIYYAKEKMDVILIDGSKVTLLKGAKLTVEKSFPSQTREVYLEGDAIFKVAKSKDHPFVVHGMGYETKVLGTVFKISQKGKSFIVDLYEGKVQIVNVTKPKESYMLKPEETFSNMGSSKVATISTSNKNIIDTKIKTATLSISGIPLMNAVKVLESTYAIKINYPANRATSIVSVNKKNVTADELIQIISIQLNLNTKIKNDNTFELEE